MREIKFRAWDKRRYKMLYPTEISFDYSGRVTVYYGVDIDEKISCNQDDVMQYTGLKDKNGKEIYEGDILCVVEEVVAEVIDGFERKELEGKIVAVDFGSEGSFGTRLGHFFQMQDAYGYSTDTWEIIGNIYENPELLTI